MKLYDAILQQMCNLTINRNLQSTVWPSWWPIVSRTCPDMDPTPVSADRCFQRFVLFLSETQIVELSHSATYSVCCCSRASCATSTQQPTRRTGLIVLIQLQSRFICIAVAPLCLQHARLSSVEVGTGGTPCGLTRKFQYTMKRCRCQ